jgi:primosomal protein N' (replication factor Y) (superfamily II helicase)
MDEKPEKFIVSVVPLTKIPLTRDQSFFYLSNSALPSGTLVSAPLFRRKIEGVILESKKDFPRLGNIELKKIDKVIEENFLNEKQLKLASLISDHYISPLGVVMKNFIPKRVKSRGMNHETLNIEQNMKKIILAKEQNDAVNNICKIDSKFKIQNLKFLLYGPSASGKTEVYIHAMLALKKQQPDYQFLILLPEKTLTPQAIPRYGAYFDAQETVVLSSNIPKGLFYSNWQKIKSGEAKVIIGTRMAVFAPFKKLGLIVIDEEQDMSYKQWDMNPRYDARTVAEKLSELHACRLIRGSATPLVESFYRAKNKELRLLELPPYQKPGTTYRLPNSLIVDMKKERWAKNYSCISKKLKSEIAYALKYKLQTILLINRQGMSSFSVCAECKAVLKCPRCDRALIYEREGYYKCLHCGYQSGIIPKCSKCGGIIFKNIGLGTQKVAKEITDIFPSAKLLVADSSTSREKDFQNKIYASFSQGQADILIGTQMISKGWDLPRVSLVGIIDTDNLLSFPDFTTQEKVFGLLTQVFGRVNRPGAKFPGNVVIQTFDPQNRIILFAAQKNYPAFYKAEIKERESLFLPPFGKVIKLIFQDINQDKTESESLRIFGILKKNLDLKVTEPHSPLLPKIRGRFRKQIVIKERKGKIPDKLKNKLKKLGQGWIIDIEPISII